MPVEQSRLKSYFIAQVVPTTKSKGVANEPIKKIITYSLALPVPHSLDAKVSPEDPRRFSGCGSCQLYSKDVQRAKIL